MNLTKRKLPLRPYAHLGGTSSEVTAKSNTLTQFR